MQKSTSVAIGAGALILLILLIEIAWMSGLVMGVDELIRHASRIA